MDEKSKEYYYALLQRIKENELKLQHQKLLLIKQKEEEGLDLLPEEQKLLK
jgi:hypothetical protein